MKKQCTLKAIAVLLILSICMSIFPSSVFAVSYLSENEKVATTDELYISDVVGENIDGVLTEADVPEIVGYQEAVAKDHIARLYEDEGSDLNKIVFLNADGSKTMYLFGFPVKYINEAGSIQDIRLEIADNTAKSGEFKTAANDVITSFPAKFTDGISLKGNETEIRLAPVLPTINSGEQTMATNGLTATVVANATAQRVDKNTIKYQYDSKTTIEYSLTYTGFKEDIVVHEYTGQTTYPFRLYTNGLELEKIEGSYYLINENGDIKAAIGDIIVFTADNRNNTFGEIIPTTIIENEEYLLNIVVDADYLTDPDTTYPIRIDPTIEVNYDEDGASAIEDITISTNTNFAGSHSSLYVGRRSTEGVARALIRFPGLDLNGFSRAAIVNASLRVRDLMCEGEQMNIYCHAFTGNVWDANSATWNSVNPDSYSASPISTVAMSWSIGDALDPIHWYTFNITEAVRGWTDGSYVQNKGLILKMDSTTESGNTIKNRTFGSYNRTSYKPTLSVTYTGGNGGGPDFSLATTLFVGTTNSVTTTLANETRYYTFTPSVTATYVIQSCNYTGDPYIWLYDSNQTSMGSNDNGGTSWNFWISKELVAGQKYYIRVGHRGTLTGSYKFTLLRVADIKETFYRFKNVNSNQYLDIHGPVDQTLIHQWTDHTGEQEKWYLEKIDGYYVIRSQYGSNKYIGISNTNIGENNIQLFDSISDSTKWTIYLTSTGRYVLEPKNAKCKVLYSPNSNTGTEMQLNWLGINGNKDKWIIPSYDYSFLNTFSAFDLGNSTEDEVALVKQRLESFGYLDIGAFNNATEDISAAKVKEIGRYSDIVYINGHGHNHANIQVRTDGGSVISEYFCAEDSVNTDKVGPRTEIGAEWLYTNDYTTTESYWNQGTKWGILAPCAQLNLGTDGAGYHWNGLNSAAIWARTLLGSDYRMHGYLGYFVKAPGGSTHIDRLTKFFDLCAEGKTLVGAWGSAHTVLGVGSSDWAAIYHVENVNDKFTSMSANTQVGTQYTIGYFGRNDRDLALPLVGTSMLNANQTDGSQHFAFSSSAENIKDANLKFNLMRDKISIAEGDVFEISSNGQIRYSASTRDWGKEDLAYNLSNDQVVEIAKNELSKLGLLPKDGYRLGITTKERSILNLCDGTTSDPETIEYTVYFYRTFNGLDMISDQEDGILISFDKEGITELRYLWRDITVSKEVELLTTNAGTGLLTFAQAQEKYFEQWECDEEIAKTMNVESIQSIETWPYARMTYLQINNNTRLVWIFSTSDSYNNSVCIDAITGEIVNT